MASDDTSVGLVALGGLGEIGMNCLALEAEGKILVVDCGVMFPSPDEPGVDVIHPSFEHLVAARDRICGIVLTHGHEDHAAGVPYLLREIDVPVYGGPYALALVERRFKESGGVGRFVPRAVAVGGSASIGPFRVQSFSLPHSIAENTGLVIEAGLFRILHTGDFKLGLCAADFGRAALERLAEMSAPGADLMICDSTGAEEPSPSGEESAVEAHLAELALETKGAVFAAVFSSNTMRMASLFEAARRSGRRVAFAGRSVETHAEVAASQGVLTLPRQLLVSLEEIADVRREELLVVAAGTQGEDRSALSRIASGEHRQLGVRPGDLVVLSSRFIPGNELAISRMIDKLLRSGARVVHRGNDPGVHVSGHGSAREIEEAVRAVRPKAFLAAHGTYRHMTAASEIARRAGVAASLAVSNGDLVRVTASGVAVSRGFAETGRVMIDGESSVPEAAMKERRLLGSRGLLHAVWRADPDGFIEGAAEIVARGVIADEMLLWLVKEVRAKIGAVLCALDPEVRRDPAQCREAVRSALRRFLDRTIGREPYVIVTILA